MDPYGVLGIPRDANEETIRTAYRILARRYHPDRGTGSSSEKFRQAREAYEILIHPASRNAHELSVRPAAPPAAVRVEPLAPQPGPFRREEATVFGRFEPVSYTAGVQLPDRFDELIEDWVRRLNELFFGPRW